VERLVGGRAERFTAWNKTRSSLYTTLGGHLGRDGVDALALSRSLAATGKATSGQRICALGLSKSQLDDAVRAGRLQVQITPRALPPPKRLEWAARA
jgi:hypothetical protein